MSVFDGTAHSGLIRDAIEMERVFCTAGDDCFFHRLSHCLSAAVLSDQTLFLLKRQRVSHGGDVQEFSEAFVLKILRLRVLSLFSSALMD